MLSYTQIFSAEKNLYNALAEFTQAVNSEEFKQLIQDIKTKDLNERLNGANYDNEIKLKNDKILNKMYYYLIGGLDKKNVKKQLCIEFNLSYEYINTLCTPYITRFFNDNAEKNIFAAVKMRAAGLTIKKIAATLGVSTATIKRYFLVVPK